MKDDKMVVQNKYYDASYEGDIHRFIAYEPIGEHDRVVYFDMDGTIADLYGVEGWLTHLESYSAYPYAEAADIFEPEEICAFIDNVRSAGWKVGIISWLAKGSNHSYDNAVISAKQEWINERLPLLDEIIFAPYGTPKHKLTPAMEAILFDDEVDNRMSWEASGPYRRAYGIEEMGELFSILSSSIDDAETGDFDITKSGDVTVFDLVFLAEGRFATLVRYGIAKPQVDVVRDEWAGEWFLSLGILEGDGSETFAEGVVIADPEHVSAVEISQLISKIDRIVYDLLSGRNIVSETDS